MNSIRNWAGSQLPARWEHFTPIQLCTFTLLFNLIAYLIITMLVFPHAGYFTNMTLYHPLEVIFLLIVLRPLVETLFFQHLLLRGIWQFLRHALIACTAVAILIGLDHNQSIATSLITGISGLHYNLLYLTLQQRGQRAFWYTAGTHACFNAVAFLHNLLVS